MKQILILGAGQSTPYLIKTLLEESKQHNWFITIGDLSLENAQRAVDNHPNGDAIEFDVNDSAMRETYIKKAHVVVSMLAPPFHPIVAMDCVRFNTHFVSASYESEQIIGLAKDAQRNGILILNEMGLDPGIDHMSAMKLIQQVRERGGVIKTFLSYGSGVPAPDSINNPLKYAITWNPRNIVKSGEAGAIYEEAGKKKVLPYQNVFQRTWAVEVDTVGTMEAYPNRNSLIYKDIFKLENVDTMIRGTLRYPGWSETWFNVVRLGLTNDTMPISGINGVSYRDFMEMFLSLHVSGSRLESRVANFLHINPTGSIMQNLKWLGLFSDEKIDGNPQTAADVLNDLLVKKLQLPENGRDMVVLLHEVEVVYPNENNLRERIQATLIEYGEPGGLTAMSKTVGLPAAIAVKLILTNKLHLTGCHIPSHPAIYEPVLEQLKNYGIIFNEKSWTVNE